MAGDTKINKILQAEEISRRRRRQGENNIQLNKSLKTFSKSPLSVL